MDKGKETLDGRMSKLENMMTEFITSQKETNQRLSNQKTQLNSAIRTVENSVTQMAKELQQRNQGALPSNTEPNPQCKAITLRSGKTTVDAKQKEAKATEGLSSGDSQKQDTVNKYDEAEEGKNCEEQGNVAGEKSKGKAPIFTEE